MPPHRAQLLVCHEQIAGRHSPGGHTQMHLQFCNLSAYAWCFDCNYYVCDIHYVSIHLDNHKAVIEYPKQTFRPADDLRAGRARTESRESRPRQ